VTKTQKISAVGTAVAVLVGLATLAASDHALVTKGALRAELEPIKCTDLRQDLASVDKSLLELRLLLVDRPENSQVKTLIATYENQKQEIQAKRIALGCG
jgi:hypothetical protein